MNDTRWRKEEKSRQKHHCKTTLIYPMSVDEKFGTNADKAEVIFYIIAKWCWGTVQGDCCRKAVIVRIQRIGFMPYREERSKRWHEE